MPSADFTGPGSWRRWDVPRGVKWVYITLNGAGSGDFRGGRVEGRINVDGTNRLYIQVGGQGEAPSGTTGGRGGYGGGRFGGNGSGSGQGGWGGGGCSVIRSGSETGAIKAVAAGAGGYSGDLGRGGQGGQEVGESGYPAPGYDDAEQPNPDNFPWLWDYPQVGNATGGTQAQGGNQGTSAFDSSLDGNQAGDTPLSLGGGGGNGRFGGGGGGGGYRSGGGGQGSSVGNDSPGGGGGGGSNYVIPVVGASSMRGEGSLHDGSVHLEWVSPPPANQPPNPPSEVKFGKDEDASNEFATLSTGRLGVSAKLTNQERRQKLRLVAQYTTDKNFIEGVQQVVSDKVERNKRAKVKLTGLKQNSLYYLRLYARDDKNALSLNYTGFTFWTNRFPTEPTLLGPGDNSTVSQLSTTVFEWTHNDPDPDSSQKAFRLQWRRAATATLPAGAWTLREVEVKDSTWTEAPNTFSANYNYEWKVSTQDQQGGWGPYSDLRSFYVLGASTPPFLLSPRNDVAVDVTEDVLFKWAFNDPDPDETQNKADLRFRAVGATDWITWLGDTTTPGADEEWLFEGDNFTPGVHYEWQARTQDSALSDVSQWSESDYFWTVATPALDSPPDFLINVSATDGSLGCGHHRVYVYDRGGKILRGEITPVARIVWSRRRDDISNCLVDTNGFSDDCGQLLSELRSWVHEIVVFRDGVRVWEGPITRITYRSDSIEIEAKDVMAYAYRRIMRQGYNDAYRVVNGEKQGLTSVVERGSRILMNALAPVDPNVLPYLTSLNFPDDARQSRSVPDYSRTSWEEVDDLAATAGLDYTTIGRRIILWDTHRPLGRLPEMREGDFSDPPVVSEYGMLLATTFAVTNNSGVFGVSQKIAPETSPYGMIEQLASAYGESEETGVVEAALTAGARTKLEDTLREQADRNIAGRYPTPLVVRVPDNSAIHPEANVRINELVPGVWIPLRARLLVREFAQWQKLDLVTVEEQSGKESVMVTMSPAPNEGQDPDAGGGLVEEG